MLSDIDTHGPLYIYNGPANLQELERINLAGARIFFNGSYSLRDLRNVNFMGATVFMNGQQTSTQSPPPPPPLQSQSRSPPRPASSERRHSDYYRPHNDLYRPGGDYLWLGPRLKQGGRERKRRRAEDVSDHESVDGLPELSSPAAAQPLTTKPSPVEPEPGRLSPYEDSDTKDGEKATTASAAGGRPIFAGPVSQNTTHQVRSQIVSTEFVESIERYAREDSQEKESQSHREAAGLSTASPSQAAKRMRVDSTNELGLSEKANSLASEELNLRLRKRVLANLGRSSQNENAKIKKLSAERQQIKSQLLQQSGREGNGVPTLLPLESPLKNFMNFAQIEEEIVQTKIQYAMAEKQLRHERQTVGRASDAIIQRVKATGKALAELYERRDSTHADRSRIETFRRPANVTKTEAPMIQRPPAPIVNLVSSDPIQGSEDGEIRDTRPPGQQTPNDPTNATKNSINPDPASASRQVRFALTDIETFIQP